MTEITLQERFLDVGKAWHDPGVRWAVGALVVALVVTPVLILIVTSVKKVEEKQRADWWVRYRAWWIFIPMIAVPILLGPGWTALGVCAMSLLCYREFARAIGLFRERLLSSIVVLGVLLIGFAAVDAWYGLFAALTPLTIALIAAAGIIGDRPKGYVQRVALAIFSFVLFGVCFGHLAFFANAPHYRAILAWLIGGVELNDVFAFVTGKTLGRHKLAPNTSPNKTVQGAVGAIVLSTAFFACVGHFVFLNEPIDQPFHLIVLGAMLSITGQFGDLTLSSVKRDLGIKDWAATFPGHGGLLDRFNSLLFAAPLAFHYINYFNAVGPAMGDRFITGH